MILRLLRLLESDLIGERPFVVTGSIKLRTATVFEIEESF